MIGKPGSEGRACVLECGWCGLLQAVDGYGRRVLGELEEDNRAACRYFPELFWEQGSEETIDLGMGITCGMLWGSADNSAA